MLKTLALTTALITILPLTAQAGTLIGSNSRELLSIDTVTGVVSLVGDTWITGIRDKASSDNEIFAVNYNRVYEDKIVSINAIYGNINKT